MHQKIRDARSWARPAARESFLRLAPWRPHRPQSPQRTWLMLSISFCTLHAILVVNLDWNGEKWLTCWFGASMKRLSVRLRSKPGRMDALQRRSIGKSYPRRLPSLAADAASPNFWRRRTMTLVD